MNTHFYSSNRLWLVVLFLTIFYSGCKNNDGRTQSEKESLHQKTINIEACVVEKSIFNKNILSNGLVRANLKSEIRFIVNQKISSVNVKNGQKVKKGGILATLESNILSNELDKARIRLNRSIYISKVEKINFGVSKLENDSISPEILETIHIKSDYLESKNTYERAKLRYEGSILRAPFDGIVANIEFKTGDYITPNDVFCTIINQNNLEIVFHVLESEFSDVNIGEQVEIIPFAYGNKTYSGKVTEINPFVDKSGMIKIKSKVINPDSLLFEGMNAKVIINIASDSLLVIPKKAVVLRSNKEVVFTVDNNRAKWNYVQIADENQNSIAIREGLNAGDTIIVSGNLNLAHDAKVKTRMVVLKNE